MEWYHLALDVRSPSWRKMIPTSHLHWTCYSHSLHTVVQSSIFLGIYGYIIVWWGSFSLNSLSATCNLTKFLFLTVVFLFVHRWTSALPTNYWHQLLKWFENATRHSQIKTHVNSAKLVNPAYNSVNTFTFAHVFAGVCISIYKHLHK